MSPVEHGATVLQSLLLALALAGACYFLISALDNDGAQKMFLGVGLAHCLICFQTYKRAAMRSGAHTLQIRLRRGEMTAFLLAGSFTALGAASASDPDFITALFLCFLIALLLTSQLWHGWIDLDLRRWTLYEGRLMLEDVLGRRFEVTFDGSERVDAFSKQKLCRLKVPDGDIMQLLPDQRAKRLPHKAIFLQGDGCEHLVRDLKFVMPVGVADWRFWRRNK